MQITAQQLRDAIGCPAQRAEAWAGPINAAMQRFEINTPARVRAFLAQIGHESGRLLYVREMWGPTPAQERYEGRADLGNTQPGDGSFFRGRGLIQITGRANYRTCGLALGLPLESSPALLEQPENAALSAAWFWALYRCNELADAGNFIAITRKINGGLNGQAERVALLEQASTVIV